MRIGWLCRYSPARDLLYGGKAYEAMLYSFLCKNYDVKNIYPHASLNNTPMPLKWLHEFNALRKFDNTDYDVLITDFYSATMLNRDAKGRKIAIIHHLDSSQKNHPYLNTILERKFLQKEDKNDTVVVPSQYWKDWLGNKGFCDVRVVYNGFNIAEYDSVSEETVETFREEYNLQDDKPIIYIGPCQKAKGVVEAANALKDFNGKIITSGKQTVKTPATNLDLSRHDFICLLKAADVVVALSKFKEGWNRVVHEAMLCKTPVIGTSQGGMTELLNGGEQRIFYKNCSIWFNQLLALPEMVDAVFSGSRKLEDTGYEYAKQFTIERFEKGWREVIENDISPDESD